MDPQTQVTKASFDVIAFVKSTLSSDLVEARRRGAVLPKVSDADLQRLIAFASQSIDASFQRSIHSFQGVIKAALEQEHAAGVLEAKTRRKK